MSFQHCVSQTEHTYGGGTSWWDQLVGLQCLTSAMSACAPLASLLLSSSFYLYLNLWRSLTRFPAQKFWKSRTKHSTRAPFLVAWISESTCLPLSTDRQCHPPCPSSQDDSENKVLPNSENEGQWTWITLIYFLHLYVCIYTHKPKIPSIYFIIYIWDIYTFASWRQKNKVRSKR